MQIRFLTDRDINIYRELRLQALKESPTAFGSSYDSPEARLRQREAEYSLTTFAARLRPDDDPASGIFGAFDDKECAIGLLGFSREHRPKRAHIASLWSMYVVPQFRRHGVGGALLDTAISHARQLGTIRQILLDVTANNIAARSLYLSRGFDRIGWERDALFVDGEYFDEEHLALYFFPPAESWLNPNLADPTY